MEETPQEKIRQPHLNRTRSGFLREVGTTPKMDAESGLPIKQHNSPIARIACWYCKKYSKGTYRFRPLYRLRDDEGKKTDDYVCDVHRLVGVGRPMIANQSMIRYQYQSSS